MIELEIGSDTYSGTFKVDFEATLKLFNEIVGVIFSPEEGLQKLLRSDKLTVNQKLYATFLWGQSTARAELAERMKIGLALSGNVIQVIKKDELPVDVVSEVIH